MSTFITSDTHLGHKKILEYTGRPFNSVGHMNEAFISNFNSVLDDDDLLIIVGDAVMGRRDENLPLFDRIRGKKLLIAGNHDYIHPMHSKAQREKWMPVYEEHFDAIVSETRIFVADAGIFVVNHFPYAGDHQENRYDAAEIDLYRPVDEGKWLLHGHVHSQAALWGPRQIHVGIDADYTPYGVDRYHPIPVGVLAQVKREAIEGPDDHE
jgi:calcineurin-like phosphoesterase family protein